MNFNAKKSMRELRKKFNGEVRRKLDVGIKKTLNVVAVEVRKNVVKSMERNFNLRTKFAPNQVRSFKARKFGDGFNSKVFIQNKRLALLESGGATVSERVPTLESRPQKNEKKRVTRRFRMDRVGGKTFVKRIKGIKGLWTYKGRGKNSKLILLQNLNTQRVQLPATRFFSEAYTKSRRIDFKNLARKYLHSAFK